MGLCCVNRGLHRHSPRALLLQEGLTDVPQGPVRGGVVGGGLLSADEALLSDALPPALLEARPAEAVAAGKDHGVGVDVTAHGAR